MHLVYVPVVHTKDKDGNEIEKICARDFWKGRDSYRNLQNAFYEYITKKGFELQRGLPVEETNRKNETIQNYKQITNFENTKKVLENITLELPDTPNITQIRKVMLNRDEKIENEIIRPKDQLIQELYQENKTLHKELSKQVNTVKIATRYEEEYTQLLESNANLKLHNSILSEQLENKDRELESKLENRAYDIKQKYKIKINKLENENKILNNMIDRFKITLKKFIQWICYKFSYSSEDELIRDFEYETYGSSILKKHWRLTNLKKMKMNLKYSF